MIEVVLCSVIVSLITLIAYQQYEFRQLNAKYINALISRTPQDLVNLELSQKVEKIQPEVQEQLPPDFVDVQNLSDEEYDQFILGRQINKGD